MKGVTITREYDGRVSQCCPPLVELIHGLRVAEVGDVVAVLARKDDEESREVIPLWLGKVREEYLGSEPARNATRFIARKVR